MAPISSDLKRISTVSKELNDLADEATAQIRALNSFLQSINVSVEVEGDWLKDGREENSRGHRTKAAYYLAYDRDDDGKVGIVAYASASVTDDDGIVVEDEYEVVWTRQLDAVRRDIRIAAMEKLPKLVRKIADEAEKASNDLRKYLVDVKAVAEELKAAMAEDPAQPASDRKRQREEDHNRQNEEEKAALLRLQAASRKKPADRPKQVTEVRVNYLPTPEDLKKQFK